MGFLDTATGFVKDTDWGETVGTIGDVADDVGNATDKVGGIIDGGGSTLPRRTPPLRNPNPTPQPEPEPTDPQPQPQPRGGGFAGMGETGVILLALAGMFVLTQ